MQVIVKLGDFFNSMDVFKIFDVIWPETPAIAAKPSTPSTEACQESSGQDNDSGSTDTAGSITVSDDSSDAEDDNVITTPDPLDDKEEESYVRHDFGVSRESESDAGDDIGAAKGLSDVGDDCEVVKEDDSDGDLVVKDGDSIGFKGDDSDDGIDGSDDGYAAQMKKEGIQDDDRYHPIKECSDGDIDEFMFQNTPWNPIQKRTVSLTDEQVRMCAYNSCDFPPFIVHLYYCLILGK